MSLILSSNFQGRPGHPWCRIFCFCTVVRSSHYNLWWPVHKRYLKFLVLYCQSTKNCQGFVPSGFGSVRQCCRVGREYSDVDYSLTSCFVLPSPYIYHRIDVPLPYSSKYLWLEPRHKIYKLVLYRTIHFVVILTIGKSSKLERSIAKTLDAKNAKILILKTSAVFDIFVLYTKSITYSTLQNELYHAF